MSSTRKIAFALGVPLVLAVFILVLAAGIYLFLPHYIESTFLPQLIAETGITEFAFNVRRVGFFGADLGGVRIGPQPNPALLIGSVQLDYSPGELYHQKIDRVLLSGIEIHAQLENGKFTFSQIDLQKLLSNLQNRQGARPGPGQTTPPVLVNRLEISNAVAILSMNHQLYRIPFEIEITPGHADDSLVEVKARLYPRGQKIESSSTIDITRRRIRLSIEISALNLGRFSDIFQLAGDVSAAGQVNLTATADLQTAPFEILALKADLELQAWRFKTNNIQIQHTDSKSLHATLAGRFGRDGSWQFKVNGKDTPKGSAEPVRFQFNQYEVVSKTPLMEVSGRAKEGMITAAYSVTVDDALMDSGAETIRLPKAVLRGTAVLSSGDEAVSTEKFELQTPGISLSSAAGKLTVKEASLSGEMNETSGSTRRFNGLLRLGGGRLVAADMEGRIENVSGDIPLLWPPERHPQKGRISIGSLNYRHLNLGRFQCEIQQTETGFDVEGRHISDLLPLTSLNFVGSSRIFNTRRPTADIRMNLSRPVGAADIDLSVFHPAAKGIKVNGKFILSGNFFMEHTQFFGSIESQLINAKVAIPQSKFAIAGIQMSLAIPRLPEVRSAPRQQLRFSKLSLGELTAANGIIDFQIESLLSFLIEKAHFEWCGGKVDTQTMRISRGIEDYQIILYCDRLNLARVLEQFGVAAAAGSGTVSGRIPIRYTNGNLNFDDGFLFSTPGAGGKIQLTGTEILTAGIAPDTPQFTQMELAREALKDYDYSWAKLNLTSEGENLLLQMQMDGKPAKTLPFVYSKDVGGFVRVDVESEGSRFQGIRLDVNFNLPLNKLLRYKDLIKMIQ